MSTLFDHTANLTATMLATHGVKVIDRVSDYEAIRCMREHGDGQESDLAVCLLNAPASVKDALYQAASPLIEKYRHLRGQRVALRDMK